MKRIILPLALLVSAPAFAFGPPPGDHDPGERLEKAMDEVDATPEQRSTIRTILEDTLPTLKGLHEEGRELREQMQDAFRGEVVDRGEVEIIRLDAIDLADRISSTALDMMVEAANVLTQDQRITLIEKREAMHGKRREMAERFEAWRAAR